MTPDVKEKRKHQRINRKFVLKVAAEGDSPVARDWTLVTTKNMSAGGVMFTYDRTLREGTPLDFTIFFPRPFRKMQRTGEPHSLGGSPAAGKCGGFY